MMARPKYRYYLCRYTLKNKNNLEVNILNYGGIVKNVFTPDKDGKLLDIALGYDSLDGKSWFQHTLFVLQRGWSFQTFNVFSLRSLFQSCFSLRRWKTPVKNYYQRLFLTLDKAWLSCIYSKCTSFTIHFLKFRPTLSCDVTDLRLVF